MLLGGYALLEEAGHTGPVSEGCIMSLTPSGLFPPPRVTEVDSLSSTLVCHDALPSQAQKGWDQPPRIGISALLLFPGARGWPGVPHMLL